MAVIAEQNTNNGGLAYFSTSYSMQTFTVPSSGYDTVTSLQLLMRKAGTPPGNITMELYRTSGGLPTGSAIATVNKTSSDFSTSYANVTFDFTDVTVSANEKLAIRVKQTSVSGLSNAVFWGHNTGGGYSGGSSYHSTNSGVSWTDEVGGAAGDFCFNVSAIQSANQGFSGEGTTGASVAQSTANGNGGGGGRDNDTTGAGSGGGGGNGAVGDTGTVYLTGTGGTGGTTSGSSDLTTMTFGGGGGGSGRRAGGSAGSGGSGGGIIFIAAATLTVTGSITANGGIGGYTGNIGESGGSGAGGSILIKAVNATLGTGLVTASGGNNGTTNETDGAAGRVHIDYSGTLSGTTTPTITTSSDSSLSSSPTYQLKLYISSTGSNSETYSKDISITTDVWKHIAVTWKASTSTATFYVDGTSIGTATGALTAIFDSTALFGLGASFNSGGTAEKFFDGLVDDVRYWSVVRTMAELSGYRTSVLVGTESNLKAYYKLDNAATDATAAANNLTLVNSPVYSTVVAFPAATTRNDIDQTDASTGNTYALTTAINEGVTHRQSFVPAKDPQKSIQVNVSAKGTSADWTLTVHDPQNRVVATKTVTNASLNTGNYEFVFDTVWTPVIGITYHFHLTATNTTGTPAVVSGTSADLETGQFTSYYQFLVTDTSYHPIDQITNLLVVGNGRYVATWNGVTYDPHRLVLPAGWKVRCFAPWREYIAIGCWKGSSISEYDEGIIFFWDGVSDTYNSYINVPQGAINAMLGSQGTLYIIAGYNGNLLQFSGGDRADKIKSLPRLENDKELEIYPGALTMWRTLLRIGAGSTDSSTFEQGIYTWGALNRNYPDSLSYDYRISTDNSQASNIKVGLVLPVGKKLLVGWKDNVSYGLDSINPASTTFGDGSIEFLIRDEGEVSKEKKLDLIRADFEPRSTSDSIALLYKLDRSSTWTTADSDFSSDDMELRANLSRTRNKEYQVRLNVSTTGTTSPAILGVTIVEDALINEQKR